MEDDVTIAYLQSEISTYGVYEWQRMALKDNSDGARPMNFIEARLTPGLVAAETRENPISRRILRSFISSNRQT